MFHHNSSKPASSKRQTTTQKYKEKLPTIGSENSRNPVAVIEHKQNEAPWMEIAIREAKQWKGARSGKITDNYHVEIKMPRSPTLSTAWCASFVNYCLKESGFPYVISADSQFPTYKANKYKFKEIPSPVYGAIMVFRRYYHATGKWTGKGHVSFVYAKDINGGIAALGGNQGNSIKLTSFSETEPAIYYSHDFKCDLDVRFYKYYVPELYYEHAMKIINEKLSVVNINEVNCEFFGKSTKAHRNESVE